MVDVTFEFDPSVDDVESVHLAGSFNDWSKSADPMTDENDDGLYTITKSLKPGEYTYKFVVNGNKWVRDPNNKKTVDDGFGGVNSVLEVEKEKKKVEKTTVGDGKIASSSLWHDPEQRKFLNRTGKDSYSFSLQTHKNDLTNVYLLYQEGERPNMVEMDKKTEDDSYSYWQREVELENDKIEYSFLVFDNQNHSYFSENGASKNEVEVFDLNKEEQVVFKTPEWVKEAVFYQIFPDRFNNANKENDPELIETYKNNEERYENITPEWHQGLMFSSHHYIDPEKFNDQSSQIYPKSGWHIKYGGDLQGVEEKFDYLKELGINAIYFNPIFEATANHRYNTAAYELIDDNLAIKGDHKASEEYFREFIKKAHENNIKIVLDAVFNHSGYEHYAFQDVIENGRDSKYWDWFLIEDYPINTLYEQRTEGKDPNYECWAGFGAHPKFDVNNPEVKEYFFEITRKWMDPNGDGDPSDGIDGWRLDVANEVKDTNPEFWIEWRNLVKEINPDAYITGEIWNNASQYLQGKEFDGVMNYKFRNAVLNFIGKGEIGAEEFVNSINETNIDYPEQSIYALQNIIDSHDTKRFLTSANKNKGRLKLAALLQFTYPGAPMIYYGDEIGMAGGSDPDNRRTMIWEERPNGEKPDQDLYNYYSNLAEIRENEEVLINGELSFIIPEESRQAVILVRENENEKIYTVINAWDRKQNISFELPEEKSTVKDLITEQEFKTEGSKLNIEIDKLSGMIFKF
ncbi:MAG: alpha amylase N-terminal ig-like domain-containing protein [Bacillota bacterium]